MPLNIETAMSEIMSERNASLINIEFDRPDRKIHARKISKKRKSNIKQRKDLLVMVESDSSEDNVSRSVSLSILKSNQINSRATQKKKKNHNKHQI